ncbi:MAG: hypothetical protein KatS3mg121_1498 [Gammaproteobacteria bacterium]|nr:MAG: hypothetical protein KatS3mg121_1498 [Gammaproteobacteria bacterium]
MKTFKLIPILSGLLLLQIALAVALYVAPRGYDTAPAGQPLLAGVDLDAVDALSIESRDGKTRLVKRDGRWWVEALDFPADADQLEKLFDALRNMQKGWPVATTDEAAERFKVAESDFERRLTLEKDGEPVAVLYVGSSPGVRRAHVRLDDEAPIYAVEFSVYQARSGDQDWIDENILKRAADAVTRIEVDGLALIHDDDGAWRLPDPDPGKETDPDQARLLADKILNLQVERVLGREPAERDKLNEPAHRIRLSFKDGGPVEYAVSPLEDKAWILKSSDNDHYFRVAQWALRSVFETDRAKLQRAAQPPAEEEEKADTPAADAEAAEETKDG